MYAINIIRKSKKGWAVFSEDGKKKLSRWYSSRAQAVKRLHQIEQFKHNAAEKPPIIPTRKEKDPTRQAGNRRKAKADISRRIRPLQAEVLAMIDAIPVSAIEVNKVKYEYQIDPTVLGSLFDVLLGMFYDALELNSKSTWFFDQYLGEAWREGTAQSFMRLTAVADGFGLLEGEYRSLDSVFSSPEYARRYEIVSSRVFENMKGFSGQAAKDLGFIIGQGVAMGESPRTIGRNIRKTFKQIEGYRSQRIARTEVNNAYNEARYEQNRDARDRLGLDVHVMHISALVESTRPSHAARHGKLYTIEEQRDFWNKNSNKINCLCSTVEIIFINGEPTQKKLIEKQRKRGDNYFNRH